LWKWVSLLGEKMTVNPKANIVDYQQWKPVWTNSDCLFYSN
jgi:hypothetical protein